MPNAQVATGASVNTRGKPKVALDLLEVETEWLADYDAPLPAGRDPRPVIRNLCIDLTLAYHFGPVEVAGLMDWQEYWEWWCKSQYRVTRTLDYVSFQGVRGYILTLAQPHDVQRFVPR